MGPRAIKKNVNEPLRMATDAWLYRLIRMILFECIYQKTNIAEIEWHYVTKPLKKCKIYYK